MKYQREDFNKVIVSKNGFLDFDKPTRKFIKKICARKFIEPPELHRELGLPAITLILDDKIIQISGERITKEGWKRK